MKHFEPKREFYFNAEGIKKEVYSDNYRKEKRVSETYSRVLDDFLNPARPLTAFIGDASEIKEFAEEAFREVTGQEFPDDVDINVISKDKMLEVNPRNVVGFAINRKNLGLVSEVFVRKDTLDRVMLVLGHELGHVLTKRLGNEKDEEAKAFAFALAWMKKIKEKNIANLSTSIQLETPAENGVHDVAFDFVLDLVNKGRDAFDVWMGIVRGLIKVNPTMEDMF